MRCLQPVNQQNCLTHVPRHGAEECCLYARVVDLWLQDNALIPAGRSAVHWLAGSRFGRRDSWGSTGKSSPHLLRPSKWQAQRASKQKSRKPGCDWTVPFLWSGCRPRRNWLGLPGAHWSCYRRKPALEAPQNRHILLGTCASLQAHVGS